MECKNELFRAGKCLRCKDFITKLQQKKVHNFIRHYEDRQFNSFELKTMDIEQYGLITKYDILVYKHKDEYDFYDAEKIASNLIKTL